MLEKYLLDKKLTHLPIYVNPVFACFSNVYQSGVFTVLVLYTTKPLVVFGQVGVNFTKFKQFNT